MGQSRPASRSFKAEMRRARRLSASALCGMVVAACVVGWAAKPAPQQLPVSPEAYSMLRWRLIGPFRAGRVTAVTGIAGDTAIYYIGTPGGGVWKTTDAGQVWKPIFDDAKVASIGALAVARSNPSIIYVGTGEQTVGNGMWKSTDTGATWQHIGLEKTHFISTVIVDPKNPDVVLVAALGDRNSGDERGVYKSTDGGRSWNKTLFKGADFGVIDMTSDPVNQKILYAALERRGGTGGGGLGAGGGLAGGPEAHPEPEIYKSTDEGSKWEPLKATGLPETGLGRIGIATAPGTAGRRVYVIVNQGCYRSDDGGANWQRMTDDPRIVSTSYFGKIFVNPKDPDDVFIGQTSMYRSTDGGKNWFAFNGAPSGDDFHVIWVNPDDPRYMIQGVDQGAIISEDGGKTWGSWYNQATGQLYHLTTDNQFPYIVYASQQDSGTVAIPSRSENGEIADAERFSIGGFEAAYIAVDPLNPNLVYSNSWYGSVVRFDRATGQIATVFVRGGEYREASMAPLAYSPQDPHALYLGTQYVLKSTDAGMSWKEISPDLTAMPPAPVAGSPSAGQGRGGRGGGRGGAINTLSPSTNTGGVIWTGSTNGRIQVTQDGGANWKDVTPLGLAPPANVQIIEASHFDANTAYVAITSGPEAAPFIFRTHDGGATWQEIVDGLPPDAIVRFVREDTVRQGLLFAGTETSVWVSFDDGDHWQSLQLNLPVTSMRDLVVHGNDLALATYGRSLYVLDDISPLRQADASVSSGAAHLFRPSNAVRVRWDVNQDTPLPKETAAGENPPDGAIIDYYLDSAATGEITLDILDGDGQLVRHYTSVAPPAPTMLPNVPEYWFAPPPVLDKAAGATRFVWDLRYPDPDVLPYSYYGYILNYTEYTLADHAIPYDTPRVQPQGPLAVAGTYTAVLTVNGQQQRQRFAVTMDPRVRASQADLVDQLAWAQRATRGLSVSDHAYLQVAALSEAIADRQKSTGETGDLADALKKAAEQAVAVQEGTRPAQGQPAGVGVGPVNRDLARDYWMIESGDERPSDTAKAAVQGLCDSLDRALDAWRSLNADTLPALNTQLASHQLAALPIVTGVPSAPACGPSPR
jgi:photosystem II stability/assembly factor-like uncharacterized protein